jgi:hypothetical protein
MLAALACAILASAPVPGATALSVSGAEVPQASHLDPSLFADLATGITLIRTFTCGGTATGEGTGFLVGTSVVMTARHVIRGACHVKVLVDGIWMRSAGITSWYTPGRGDLNAADLATIKLPSNASGHVFTIRSWSAGVGVNLSVLGHPLGEGISLSQGHVIRKLKVAGVPVLAVRLLGAEGESGSPLVDDKGNVVGILQIGLGSKDLLGQRTSGLILGIDLPSWWSTARKGLCRAYPNGGIQGCAPKPPPPPPPPPPPTYHVQSCWTQDTGNSIANVNPAAGVTSIAASDLSQAPQNYWTTAQLDATPTTTIKGVTLSLIEPNGAIFATDTPFDWATTYISESADLNWTFSTDNSLFFKHPEITGQGAWTFRWNFPDGEVCTSTITVG